MDQKARESLHDCSWIQDFEADFPKKVSLKMLNLKDYNSISHLFSVSLKTLGHLHWQLLVFVGMILVLIIEFLKFRISIWTFTLAVLTWGIIQQGTQIYNNSCYCKLT